MKSALKTDMNDIINETIKPVIINLKQKLLKEYEKNNELFTLWISDDFKLPELQQLSLKSMVLTGHKVTLYTYNELKSVPEGVEVADANKILDKSNIFKYKEGFNKGSYSGFANFFRVKCLYEKGTSWFDCDTLAIKNINYLKHKNPIISSEYDSGREHKPKLRFFKVRKREQNVERVIKIYQRDR